MSLRTAGSNCVREMEHIVLGNVGRGKRDAVGGPFAKMMETEEALGHLIGIQRCCERKGPTESNAAVQGAARRPGVWPTDPQQEVTPCPGGSPGRG